MLKNIFGNTPFNASLLFSIDSIALSTILQYCVVDHITKSLGVKPNYSIMDETDARALMKLSIDKANVTEIEERFPTAKFCKDILSFSINCNMEIKEVILWKYSQFDSEKVLLKLRQVFKIYVRKKAEDGLLDFDDLLVFWNRLLDEKSVAKLIAKRINYILVDEYQDTNHIQDEIIYKIASQNPKRNMITVRPIKSRERESTKR